MRRLSPRSMLLLALGALMAYRGGLHAWQAVAGWALLAWAWGLGPAPRLERAEVWGLGILLGFGALTFFSARLPQAHINTTAFLAALGLLFVLLRREEGWSIGLAAALWAGLGLLASAVFLAVGMVEKDVVAAARWISPNQNILAGTLLVPAFLVCVAWAQTGRRFAWILATLPAAALALAGSRGATWALACASAWLLWRSRAGQRWIAVGLLGLLALVVWQAPFARLPQRAAAWQPIDSLAGRQQFWAGSARLSLQAPWLGHGWGSFSLLSRNLDLPTPAELGQGVRYQMGLEHAHNDWLESAVESGWPWTLLLGAGTLWWWRRRWNLALDEPYRRALEAGLLGILAQSLVDMPLRAPGVWVSIALVVAALEPVARSKAGRRWPWALGLLLMGLLAVGLWSARQGSRTALERAAWLQPFDAALQARRLQQGLPVHRWSDWSGWTQPEWLQARSMHAAKGGQMEAALFWAERAVRQQPLWAPGWHHLGLLLEQAGRPDDAQVMMAHALELEPNFARVLAWSYDRALERGDISAARAYLKRILGLSKRLPESPTLDSYSRFILEIDPSWLEARNENPELSTVFKRRS